MGGTSAPAHWCPACGEPGAAGADGHGRCVRALELDPPRFCSRCGRGLDVQVYPTGFAATCRRCDGVHPRDRGRSNVMPDPEGG